MIIETERLMLKTLSISDAEYLLNYYADNKEFLKIYEPKRESGFFTIKKQEELIESQLPTT